METTIALDTQDTTAALEEYYAPMSAEEAREKSKKALEANEHMRFVRQTIASSSRRGIFRVEFTLASVSGMIAESIKAQLDLEGYTTCLGDNLIVDWGKPRNNNKKERRR